ncbi:methionine ABC transporter ATP-binding protein [Actinophytocola xanthii]|uniref:Methionine ABC transporter ATP-binding protein n=1 Tax=Actinophytocola xanthii TaxID=1912961 RepID=A0A1Q8CY49_9PSEU|nr:methionine ABC transporter ATP-binding protein [Actinophytocola xanthii]OLF19288.1 methionine ABC transporter ATP-binding protein [Actinophytocola xanthii]
MAIIELDNVSKVFPPAHRGAAPVSAVEDVTLHVEAGEIAGIIGYSGAGKSTLVRLVNALEKATSGTVTVDGTTVTGLSERRLREVRLGIGMIFQQFNLFSSRTVWGNIAYPLQIAQVPKSQHQKRISELLHFVGLADKAHSYPEQLSGGQKQRVGIARALATSPKVLLADEATSALDPETTRDVLQLLKKVNVELGITTVVITHELEVVRAIADRVVVMERGRVVEDGAAFDVFARPRHPTTKRFVGTLIDGVPTGATLESLRANHTGRLVTLSFDDESLPQSQAFAELISGGIEFELVHGGMEDIQGRSFGNLTLALRGEDAAIDHALGRLRERVAVTEAA